VRRTLLSVAVALAGAAAITVSGWSLEAAALPAPAHADRVAADASTWLHDYRLVVDVFHVDHRRVKGACLRGWFPDPNGVKTQASLLSLRSGPVFRLSGRRRVVLRAGKRDRRLHLRLLALAGCSGTLSRFFAAAAQSGGDLSAERSYAANQPAIALKLDRGKHEHFTLYVSPSTFQPLVVIVERDHRAATARLYLNRITPRLLRRFRFPLQHARTLEP
jgi:hypothetical protein